MAQCSTSSLLMVEPNYFLLNVEASKDNAFMNKTSLSNDELRGVVMKEFNGLVQQLRDNGVEVQTFPSIEGTPDAVFPNNWFGTTLDEQNKPILALFPMKVPCRRLERNNEKIRKYLKERYGEVEIDLSIKYEKEDKYLESTGSMVLDHVNRIAFLSLSQRSDYDVAIDWATKLNFTIESFESSLNDIPIYHTNVICAIGTHFAVICLDAIHDKYKESVKQKLSLNNRNLIIITTDQLNQFCGNVLEVQSKNINSDTNEHDLFVAMSDTAYNAFTDHQKNQFKQSSIKAIIHADISNIERIGGGSVRCMLAELY